MKAIRVKIDVQPHENDTLCSAAGYPARIEAIRLGLCPTPLYSNQLTFTSMREWLSEPGFDSRISTPESKDGEIDEFLRVDCIFRNRWLQ